MKENLQGIFPLQRRLQGVTRQHSCWQCDVVGRALAQLWGSTWTHGSQFLSFVKQVKQYF